VLICSIRTDRHRNAEYKIVIVFVLSFYPELDQSPDAVSLKDVRM
jgi:hypothetical protein